MIIYCAPTGARGLYVNTIVAFIYAPPLSVLAASSIFSPQIDPVQKKRKNFLFISRGRLVCLQDRFGHCPPRALPSCPQLELLISLLEKHFYPHDRAPLAVRRCASGGSGNSLSPISATVFPRACRPCRRRRLRPALKRDEGKNNESATAPFSVAVVVVADAGTWVETMMLGGGPLYGRHVEGVE